MLWTVLALSEANSSVIDLPRRTREEDADMQSRKRKGADDADALRTGKREGYPNENPEQPGLMNSKGMYQSMTIEFTSDIKTPALCPHNETREQMDWRLGSSSKGV